MPCCSVFVRSTLLTVTFKSQLFTMNTSIENTMPMTIAVARSNTTVASMVTINCDASIHLVLVNKAPMFFQLLSLHAVTIKIPAKADNGIRFITEPSKNIDNINVME